VATVLLKICGLRHSSQAAAIAALGVDAIGVIAVPGSPRFLDSEQRPALFAAVKGANRGCRGVVVVADPAADALDTLQAAHGHDVVQLHGDESPERCAQLRALLPDLALWKALRIRSEADLAQVELYDGVVDAVLLDAWVPGVLGGTGHRIPLDWLERFTPPMPWWLAGGIDAGSAAEALARLAPTGLDASSALEHSPGDKDLTRVCQLVAVVRATRQDRIDPSAPPPSPCS
jgi:phosphoribosylanthranilate isomerase